MNFMERFFNKDNTLSSEQNNICDDCFELIHIMDEAELNPNANLRYVYNYMKERYNNHKLDLYFSDCSFENFFEEIYEEKHYTYYVYLQCPKCKKIFELGVCVRGLPIYKVLDVPPEADKLKEVAFRDNKKVYLKTDI